MTPELNYVFVYLLLLGPGYFLMRVVISSINGFFSKDETRIDYSKFKEVDKILWSSLFGLFILVISMVLPSSLSSNIIQTILTGQVITATELGVYLFSLLIAFVISILCVEIAFVLWKGFKITIESLYKTICFVIGDKKSVVSLLYSRWDFRWNLLKDVKEFLRNKNVLFTLFLKDSTIRGYAGGWKSFPELEICIRDAEIRENKNVYKVKKVWIPNKKIEYYSLSSKIKSYKRFIKYPYEFWFVAGIVFSILCYLYSAIGYLILAAMSFILAYVMYKKKGFDTEIKI
jgi:hypothetical protein